jgi:hypothetical protein
LSSYWFFFLVSCITFCSKFFTWWIFIFYSWVVIRWRSSIIRMICLPLVFFYTFFLNIFMRYLFSSLWSWLALLFLINVNFLIRLSIVHRFFLRLKVFQMILILFLISCLYIYNFLLNFHIGFISWSCSKFKHIRLISIRHLNI